MALDALVGKYAWVNRIEGWTVAVMQRRSVDEVVRIYGGGRGEPMGELAFVDMDRHRGPDPGGVELFVQVVTGAEFTATLEHNGWSGSFPEIARRCSAGGGWSYGVTWNVNGAGMVTQAVDGTIVARFESLFSFEPEPRGDERRPGWAIGPRVDPDLAWQVCMAQLEQRTGVEVEERWLREPHPTFRIPEPYSLYRDVEGADRY
ncbi:hypothetical protein [Actinophytocola sp.]|uniref:hypothetical protein n=1 Tax=Actinophytocola sp. TaxID=1872138 RepID=UPI00389B2CFD